MKMDFQDSWIAKFLGYSVSLSLIVGAKAGDVCSSEDILGILRQRI